MQFPPVTRFCRKRKALTMTGSPRGRAGLTHLIYENIRGPGPPWGSAQTTRAATGEDSPWTTRLPWVGDREAPRGGREGGGTTSLLPPGPGTRGSQTERSSVPVGHRPWASPTERSGLC